MSSCRWLLVFALSLPTAHAGAGALRGSGSPVASAGAAGAAPASSFASNTSEAHPAEEALTASFAAAVSTGLPENPTPGPGSDSAADDGSGAAASELAEGNATLAGDEDLDAWAGGDGDEEFDSEEADGEDEGMSSEESSEQLLPRNGTLLSNGTLLDNISAEAFWHRPWGHHHHHHGHHHRHHDHDHHHHGRGGGGGQGKVLTLYHQTSCSIAHAILGSGFKPGHSGWCGGGIYFAVSPADTYHKAIGPDSHLGCIIQARVALGRLKHMGRHCDRSMSGGKLSGLGYDSITFNPGDGDEYVVYSSSRVLSMRIM